MIHEKQRTKMNYLASDVIEHLRAASGLTPIEHLDLQNHFQLLLASPVLERPKSFLGS